MPNHCSNVLVVTGSEEEVKRFKETCCPTKKGNSEFDAEEIPRFDFDKVMPMPADLQITSGGNVNNAIAIIKAEAGDSSDIQDFKGYAWIIEKCGENATDEQVIAVLKERLTDEDMVEGRKGIENQEKYGCRDWYSWCTSNDNWGTKWGAYEHIIECDEPTHFQTAYQTAWSPGSPAFFEKLSKMFPSLHIENQYIEEGCGFAGIYTMQNGNVDDDFHESGTGGYVDIAEQCFGIVEDDYEDEVNTCNECDRIIDDGKEVCDACAERLEHEIAEAEVRAKMEAELKQGFDREALSKENIIPKEFYDED